MIIDEAIVLKDYEIKEKLENETLILYGAGQDAQFFCEKYSSVFHIDCCMAQNALQNMGELEVHPVEEVLANINDRKIIVCSRAYAYEMKKNLEEHGLVGGADFWVWDSDYTENVRAFIEYNRRTVDVAKAENVILIPIEGCHDGTTIIYRYFVPYLAQKLNARVVGYIRQGGNRFESTIFPSVMDIYKSIGMETVAKQPETGYTNERIEAIYNEIISGIHSMDDWNEISIDGLDCGVSFLRNYLRKYDLDFQPTNAAICECLVDTIKTVLFWKDYFKENRVASVILWDGVHNESFLRDIAIENSAKTYIIHPRGIHKAYFNHNFGENFPNLKLFYDSLSDREKEQGVEWAKQALQKILLGQNGAYLTYRNDNNVFHYKTGELELPQKQNVRVLICPHIFNEDQWCAGEQLCANNYLSWLLFLGEIIDATEYEWYIKLHPDETDRGNRLIEKFLKEHPKLTLLPARISPLDLKEAEFDYALTINGSIGHEYPLLGINVINAGNNPHMSFDFNITPSSKEEYREILMNISDYSALDNKEDIYKYYCLYYMYYQRNDFSEGIRSVFDYINFYKRDRENTIYRAYLDNRNPGNEEKIWKMVKKVLDDMDGWQPGVFYKKSEDKIKILLDSVE